MSQNINRKDLSSLANAPTPQNTPASVTNSYLKSNPLLKSSLPTTIKENDEDGLADLKSKLTSNPQFLSMIQGKLGSLVGAKSNYVDSLPKAVKNRIYSLKTLQSELTLLEDEFQKELFELEKKYQKKYEPVLTKRSKIINGDVEPTEEEISKGKEIEKDLAAEDGEEPSDEEEEEEEEEEDEEADEEEKVKGIPDFWLTALQNLRPLSYLINERDEEVLSYLANIELKYLEKPGFQLLFHFKENPFFKNSTLTKTYYYQDQLGYSGDFIYDHAEGSTIDWISSSQNVTVNIERRKQRNKSTQQTRTIEKLTPIDSFFNFFDPPSAPEDEDDEFDEEELEEKLALDYQIGEDIKDKLIPRAIDWFTGSAIDFEEEEFDEEDAEEEFDEQDEESEEESDDEEGAEGEEKKQPPECKQS